MAAYSAAHVASIFANTSAICGKNVLAAEGSPESSMRPSSGVQGLPGQVYVILLARMLLDASSNLSNDLRKGFTHLLLLHSSRRLHIAQFLVLKNCAKRNHLSVGNYISLG